MTRRILSCAEADETTATSVNNRERSDFKEFRRHYYLLVELASSKRESQTIPENYSNSTELDRRFQAPQLGVSKAYAFFFLFQNIADFNRISLNKSFDAAGSFSGGLHSYHSKRSVARPDP